ncbi:MAG: thiamine pyrophosphate-binding protein [Nitrospinota bacterium]
MPTYADVVAGVLAEAQVEFIFGVPGSLSSVELIEAASQRGIRYILCSNESSAAVMAGTYGIFRRRPGVCSTGVGPGAAAAVLGVTNNWLERAPCLILTDRYSDPQFRQLQRQRVDQDLLYRPITKGTFKLAAGAAATTMRQAIRLAMAGRPGPVHVDLPYDVMLAQAPEGASSPAPEGERHIARAGADHPGLQAAAGEIARAQRPVLIAGLQVNRSGEAAERALRALAERLGAPVFNSPAAKGAFPEQHPLAAGTFRGRKEERALLGKADLLVLAGYDPVELFAPGFWDYPQPVVMLDEVPHLEDLIRPQVEVVAHLADSLEVLSRSASPCRGWDTEEVESYRRMIRAPLHPRGSGLMPGAVIRIAREQLPDRGILTADAGNHKVLAGDLWEARRPQGYLSSNGLGAMAVGLPAALAAKLAEPAAPVVCMTGDGGFLMRLGDLEVAAREKIAVVTIVFNDGWLSTIKLKQDERRFARRGTSFAPCDFVSVAKGLGCEASRAATERELQEALPRALASGRPWVIDAVISPEGYAA